MVKIGEAKNVNLEKRRKLNKSREEFINFAEIGEFINFVDIGGGICNMRH